MKQFSCAEDWADSSPIEAQSKEVPAGSGQGFWQWRRAMGLCNVEHHRHLRNDTVWDSCIMLCGSSPHEGLNNPGPQNLLGPAI